MIDFFLFFLTFIMLFALMLLFAGAFETIIVRQCTACGKKGKLRGLSHFFEALLEKKPASIFGYSSPQRKKFFVCHNHILCKSCLESALDSIRL